MKIGAIAIYDTVLNGTKKSRNPCGLSSLQLLA